MSSWKLVYNKFTPENERLREALCTLGNGYLGTRGAAAEASAGKIHYPGTYIAGVYNDLETLVAKREVRNDDFVNCPNWLMLNYRIGGGPWFDQGKVKILSWKFELNVRDGVLVSRVRWQDKKGRITLVEQQRIVSMASPHHAALRCTLTPENYSGKITIRSGIDGLVINAGVDRYKKLNSKHLSPCGAGRFSDDGIYVQVETNRSHVTISEAARTLVYKNNKRIFPKLRVLIEKKGLAAHEFTLDAKKKSKYSFEKLVSIYTSRDHGVSDDCKMAKETVSGIKSFNNAYTPHKAKWHALWRKFDIELKGDDFVQKILRLHTFHLLQTASPNNQDIDAGLPARGLHGEAYRGHIFWDEMYVYPFFNLRMPEITRAFLMYRYRRLDPARAYAREYGYRGAMFPWQSGNTGEEKSQVVHLNPMSGKWDPDYSSIQRHISIAVAYNTWTYYNVTGDKSFLDRYGAEMILEIAHFWSSISKLNVKTKRYEIAGVMGPDEFHEHYPGSKKGGVKNNAYTNIMAVWVLNKALGIIDSYNREDRAAILSKVGVDNKEIVRWRHITKKMTIPVSKTGLVHQFDGYMKLKELEWEKYRKKYGNIHRVDRILKAEGMSPDHYKVAKQADVLMLFYVLNEGELKGIFKQLGYSYPKNLMKKNFDYYEPRTSHGSTLSRVVHSFVAELIGYEETAMDFYVRALRSDIYDTQGGTTQEGIHAGVMAGTVYLFLRNYVGLSIEDNTLCFRPKLPKKWKKIKFYTRYKDISFDIQLTTGRLRISAHPVGKISLLPSKEIPITVRKKTHKLLPGKPLTVKI